jgi:putative copper export protein
MLPSTPDSALGLTARSDSGQKSPAAGVGCLLSGRSSDHRAPPDISRGQAAHRTPGRMGSVVETTWRLLHLAAAAYWLGGLIALAIVAVVARRTLPPDSFGLLMRRAGRAFAAGAALAGVVLAATGIALARERLPSWEELTTTPWGRTLALKTTLAVVVAMLALVHSWTGSRTDRPAVVISRALSPAILLITLAIFYLAARLAS